MDTASTSDAVNFITYVQTLKRKIKQFEKNVDVSTQEDRQYYYLIAFLCVTVYAFKRPFCLINEILFPVVVP